MFPSLKDHPFAVEAFFESSLVLTFAVPWVQAQRLIPECLQLDRFNEWAFIAAAMVQTTSLRPKGFPKAFGNDFFLIGYRVFVRYRNQAGKNLRGLYILRSETDKKRMQLLGNLFTHYSYTTTDINKKRENGFTKISSQKSDFSVIFEDAGEGNPPLPAGSPFADWKEARRYSGPLPFTFTWKAEEKKVLIVEGEREKWHPSPVKVVQQHFSFIDQLGIRPVKLANAFIVRNIPYCWKKGKIE